MLFAPGVEFFEDKHEYYYKGKKLSGVTGLIAKKLGLKMPEEFVGEHRDEGLHVHHAIQRWITTGNPDSIHPGVKWLTERLYDTYNRLVDEPSTLFSEVLVSDLKQYASAVDIVAVLPNGVVQIYDIKKGIFKRDYVSWQLGIYKYFIETYSEYTVKDCTCACMKDQEMYPIFPKSKEDVEKLLYAKK
jgi:hypothetical protein